jgi:hypothetical protein
MTNAIATVRSARGRPASGDSSPVSTASSAIITVNASVHAVAKLDRPRVRVMHQAITNASTKRNETGLWSGEW